MGCDRADLAAQSLALVADGIQRTPCGTAGAAKPDTSERIKLVNSTNREQTMEMKCHAPLLHA